MEYLDYLNQAGIFVKYPHDLFVLFDSWATLRIYWVILRTWIAWIWRDWFCFITLLNYCCLLFLLVVRLDYISNRALCLCLLLLFKLFLQVSSKVTQEYGHEQPCEHQMDKKCHWGKEQYCPKSSCAIVSVHGLSPSFVFEK